MIATTLITLSIAGTSLASYAPNFQACPGNATLLRLTGTPNSGNQTLNPDEVTYIAGKKALVPAALATYLGSLASTVYGGALDATVVPTISLAISGGGDRAGLYGAGVLSAMDGRNASSNVIGGLLQTASYISALSGGSWMLTSLLFNDFPQIYPMILGSADGTNNGWSLQNDLFTPINASYVPNYVAGIMADLTLKRNAGFPVSFGDYWTRTLARHYLPGTTYANFFDNTTSDHGASYTFSSIPQLSSFKAHALPFPIIVGAVLSPSDKDAPLQGAAIPLSNVVYEMTPFEFGSYDPMLAAFIPMNYLGTAMKSGTPYGGNSAGNCVNNFDNAGFITGISSNLFNLYNASNNAAWSNSASPINVAWNLINNTFFSVQPTQEMDISAVPNPFQGLQPGIFEDSTQTQLTLVDGGIDGQVDPIAPLEVPARNIDLMIVVDGSADTDTHYPIGHSMVATALRSQVLAQEVFSMPPLPLTTDTYVAQGLAIRPSFFGCKGTPAKLNGTKSTSPYPLVVYLPNYDPTGVTNTSTSQLVYSNAQASRFLDVASSIATRGIPTASGGADPLWATCLACTTVERVRGRNGIDQTAACTACFSRYCWSGVESAAAAPVNGTAAGNSTTTAAGNSTSTAVKPTATGVVAPSTTATAGAGRLVTSVSASVVAIAAFYLF